MTGMLNFSCNHVSCFGPLKSFVCLKKPCCLFIMRLWFFIYYGCKAFFGCSYCKYFLKVVGLLFICIYMCTYIFMYIKVSFDEKFVIWSPTNNLFLLWSVVLLGAGSLCYMTWGISAPGAGIELGPPQWKPGILATRSPGISLTSAFHVVSNKSLSLGSQTILRHFPLFSSRSCRVFTYMLGFVVHFKLIFMCEVKEELRFSFWY